MAEHRLFNACELGPAQVRQVEIEGREPLAVYNLDGCYFATDDTCTHGSASLSEGDIEGEEIVCPFHLGAFDIRSGEPTVPPCDTALRTYPVRLEDGVLVVELDPR